MSRNRHRDIPRAPAEVLLHRDLSTSQQIGMLLPICQTMMGYLLSPEREHENIPGAKTTSGEAWIAAENTFTRACERLDEILGESARWGIAFQLRLEQQYNERHEQQVGLMAAQRAAAEQQQISAAEVVSPQFRYKPALIPMEDGKWVAFLGHLDDLESGIIGIGDSPAAALKSFNDAFKGETSPAVKQWLEQHEKDMDAGVETTLAFPKNENDTKMDPSGNRTTPTPADGQEILPGDFRSPESESGIGGA